jgi:DNA polymerase-4
MVLRKIIHVDMDAFYASVEQRDNPDLRGRPVAVGHAAKRGVVAAASYEARACGVRSAMPSTTAMRRCVELVFVPPRFEVYRTVSRQIHAIFSHYTALIEPLSLDEAYLDVTQDLRGLRTASATAKEIRTRILQETGLTASAAISYNKFLAKLASPWGWPVTAAKMQQLGVQTGAHLRMKSLAFLQRHFGKSAEWYLAIANGEDERPVIADRPRKSSGSETTFARDLTSADEIESGTKAIADEVWAWCEKANAFGRNVTVKVKFADFHQVTRSRSFPVAIARRDLLQQASVELVRMLLPTVKGVRLLGVTVSNFDRAQTGSTLALPLLAPSRRFRRPALRQS